MRKTLRNNILCLCTFIIFGSINAALAQEQKNIDTTLLQQKISSLFEEKKYNKALPYAKNYARLIKNKYGRNHQKYSNSLYNIGVIYSRTKDPRKSYPYFRKALTVLGLTGPVPPKAPANKLIF